MKVRRFGTIGGVLCWLAVCAFTCTDLLAQEYSPHRASGHLYYAAAAPLSDSGAIDYPLGVGGGGQVFLTRGLTAGTDFGYYSNPRYRDVDFGLFSANLGYYFKDRKEFKRFDPFVLGGYGLMRDERSWNLGFGGFGFETWFTRRIGMRIDMRMYGGPGAAFGTFHAGISFR